MKILDYELNKFTLPLITSNMYVIISEDEALIIDPNTDGDALELLRVSGIKSVTVILTHEHIDHISGVNGIRDYLSSVSDGRACMVYAGNACAESVTDPTQNLASFFEAMFITRSDEERDIARRIFDKDYCCSVDVAFKDHMELKWKNVVLVLRETPGHSPGSICVEIWDHNGKMLALSTGDSLVQGNKVITRLPGGSKKQYNEITRPYLESFAPDTVVLPGHGEISLMKDLELG